MEDLIRRSDAIYVLKQGVYANDTLIQLNKIPAIKLPQVVYCEKCRRYDCGSNETDIWSRCRLLKCEVYPEFYCAYGEE